LTRHYAAPQLAPRARWQGREYDFLGHASVFRAYDEDEWLHVLCDDDGHVLAVESDLYSGGLICRCQKCGRWSEDVSEGLRTEQDDRLGVPRILRRAGGLGLGEVGQVTRQRPEYGCDGFGGKQDRPSGPLAGSSWRHDVGVALGYCDGKARL
jgi:hypothetical protein